MKEFEPIRIDRRKPAVDTERFPVFYITDEKGEEKEYTAPKRIPAGMAIKALTMMATRGYAAAAGFMANEALGADAVNALYESPQLTHEEAKSVMTRLADLFWGQAEDMATGAEEGDESGN
jgi:hypothetical protein